jgi:hypothetical protein
MANIFLHGRLADLRLFETSRLEGVQKRENPGVRLISRESRRRVRRKSLTRLCGLV